MSGHCDFMMFVHPSQLVVQKRKKYFAFCLWKRLLTYNLTRDARLFNLICICDHFGLELAHLNFFKKIAKCTGSCTSPCTFLPTTEGKIEKMTVSHSTARGGTH